MKVRRVWDWKRLGIGVMVGKRSMGLWKKRE